MQRRTIRYTAAFLFLAVLLFVLFMVNINGGTVELSFRECLAILFRRNTGSTEATVVWDIRLPRAIAALILGGALSVSGFLLQTFFGNPIAGPYVLGISSGAKLVVALTMIFLLGRGMTIGSAGMILAAFAGSMLSMGFVLAVSRKVSNMSMLVVCGIMIGYICSAITDFVVTFAEDSNIVNLHNWS
ncbi:MAG: iron ABC transporter permease, partial [Clostridiales bacterium]|nr:iron ABC transporter permease [Clostridiales bacterium]